MKKTDDEISRRIVLHKVLADAGRYRAIMMLSRSKAPLSVGEVAEFLDMQTSTASHLLAYLHRADIVAFERDGRIIRYCLAKTLAAKQIVKLIA